MFMLFALRSRGANSVDQSIPAPPLTAHNRPCPEAMIVTPRTTPTQIEARGREGQRTAMSKCPREFASWKDMHCLAVGQFDEAMLLELFDVASRMKAMVASKGKSDVLRGKVLANVFYEPSTRTMCSFDAAMKRLGGDVLSVSESSSSAKKGETIEDTVRCLQCYCDVLVLRHPQVGTVAKAAALTLTLALALALALTLTLTRWARWPRRRR